MNTTMRRKDGMKASPRGGQSLIEILVAMGIGVILIGGVTALISVNTKSSMESKMNQAASSLTQEVIDGVRSKAEGDWNAFYALPKGSANAYYIASSTNVITAGKEAITVSGYAFDRYFYLENVNRTQCGIGSPTTAAATASCNSNFPLSDADIAEDPSTQKIVVIVEWTGGRSLEQSQYVSRMRNVAIRQTDWSGGGGDNSVLTVPNNKYAAASGIDVATTPGAIKVILSGGGGAAAANIDAIDHWAWNDITSWIDFGYAAGNVGVNDTKLFGYASSPMGLIAFDCATTPNGNICAGPAGNWGVTNTGGTLRGWAYSDSIGWISFDSVTAGSPVSYGVTIDAASGEFKGWAWNDVVGWISMNCSNAGTCNAVNYKVKTSWTTNPNSGWLTSPIIDLGNKVAVNTAAWKGIVNGGMVRFQIAASNVATGPWNDADYKGPDGTSGTSYDATAPNVSIALSPRDFSGVRYVRYKVFVDSNVGHTSSPEVQDIILTYGL